jgi:hypothetical protein
MILAPMSAYCSAISRSLLRQPGFRNFASSKGFRSPAATAKDGHPGRALEVRNRSMHSYIHLIQGLLHPPGPVGLVAYQRRQQVRLLSRPE